jgi:ubiquinone/menaquinone biosynthesis C-methylase UbiE
VLVRKVADLLARSAPRAVLEAGCGTGLFSIGLAASFSRSRFLGLDRSPGMIAIGRRQATRRGLKNLSFQTGDAQALPFPGATFDAVVAAGLFPNLNQPAVALREFARVLGAEGQLIIVEFDRRSMTPAVRLFFNVMIAGYHVASRLCRRFRFAESWDVDASLINEEPFKDALQAAGFQVHAVERLNSHLVLACAKGY